MTRVGWKFSPYAACTISAYLIIYTQSGTCAYYIIYYHTCIAVARVRLLSKDT